MTVPIEEFDVEAAPDEAFDPLGHVGKLAAQLVMATKDVEDAERVLEDARERRRAIAERDLPDAMNAAGLTAVDLQDGRRIVVEDVWRTSIAKGDREKDPEKQRAMWARRSAWFAWLREKNFGAIIKRFVTVEFPAGRDRDASALAAELTKRFGNSAMVRDAEDVHHQTLLALVREQGVRGASFPEELGVARFAEAKIKEKRK